MNLSSYLVALTFLVGVYRWKRLQFEEKGILFILFLNLGADIAAQYLAETGMETLFLYNVMTPTEQVLTILIYSFQTNSKKQHRLLLWSIPIMIGIALINLNFGQGLSKLNTISFAVNGFWVAVQSYVIIRETIMQREISENDLPLWFAGANFLYYPMVIPIVIAAYALPQFTSTTIKINLFVYGCWAILLSLGFLWKPQSKTT